MQQGVHEAAAFPPTLRDGRVSLLPAARPPRARPQPSQPGLHSREPLLTKNDVDSYSQDFVLPLRLACDGVVRASLGPGRCGDAEDD
jgi:hypothetical protein